MYCELMKAERDSSKAKAKIERKRQKEMSADQRSCPTADVYRRRRRGRLPAAACARAEEAIAEQKRLFEQARSNMG
eukprot:scaffold4969_cov364-Prasinococcus_capsulatus_cf.AAC.5